MIITDRTPEKGTEMELKSIDKASADKRALESIHEEAIPEAERVSLDEMMDTGAEVIGIYEDGEPAGYLMIRHYKKIVYLAFLAVRRDLRSGGIGSEALRMLISAYPDRQIVVEYEAPEKSSPAASIRARRKAFYLRNGFYDTGWNTCYDGTEFEIGCSAQDFDVQEFAEFADYLATFITDHIPRPCRRNVT